MTVQGGGGGGRKIPPGPGAAPAATTPRGGDAAVKKPATTPAGAPHPGPEATSKDGFEAQRTDPRRGGERALPSPDVASPSGIDSMVRVLEDTRSQILDDHRALRGRLNALVGVLVARGFERAVLDEHRAELTALRTRMAALRRRLQQIQRRLRAAASRGRADPNVSVMLAPHLERLQTLEPGLQRALLALQMMEIALVEPWGGQSVSVGGDDMTRLGDDLARSLPGAALTEGVARLLGDGVEALTRAPPAATTGVVENSDSDDLGRLKALQAALKGSL